MKRTLKIILSTLLCLTSILTVSTFALAEENHCRCTSSGACTHENGDITVEFFSDTIDEETKARITEDILRIKNGEELPTVQSKDASYCYRFGHTLEYEYGKITHHYYYPTPPKCQRENYTYESCINCNYTNYTFSNAVRIDCCP